MKARTISKYMGKVTKTDASGNTRRYHVGDRFLIEVTTCAHDRKDPHDLMSLWKKHGYVKDFHDTTLFIDTYYTDDSGQEWGYYNILEKPSEDGKSRLINFDYLREATPENERELVAECIRLAVRAGAID